MFGNTELHNKNSHPINTLPGTAFQCLSLIQNHVLPFDPLEVLDILDYELVACDHHMEWCILSIKGFLKQAYTNGGREKELQTRRRKEVTK